MTTPLKIILADVNSALVDAWKIICGKIPNVSVHHGSIFEVECDAIVSPANSFGFMDGGFDYRISEFFGWQVQERLQQRIQTEFYGELLVGQAALVPTDHHRIPYVISAPTMRVPMILGGQTVNVFLATRAVLLLIQRGMMPDGTPVRDHVKTVAIPGLGTGVGRVPYGTCAKQMRKAIETVVFNEYPYPRTWMEAQMAHQLLYADNPRDLQRPE